jgi:hypothetical protein
MWWLWFLPLPVVCLLLIVGPVISIEFGCNVFTTWFTAELSNAEFRCMLELIFTDPQMKVDIYRVVGDEYSCWIANGYFGFSVNEIKRFTPYQKWLFFKRFRKWRYDQLVVVEDKLHKDKLQALLFRKKLDSMLEEENDNADN